MPWRVEGTAEAGVGWGNRGWGNATSTVSLRSELLWINRCSLDMTIAICKAVRLHDLGPNCTYNFRVYTSIRVCAYN